MNLNINKKLIKMKNINLKTLGMLILIAFFMSACEKWIDPEINTDPSNPQDVTMDLLLPPAESMLGYQFGGDFTYAASMWMQQISGVSRQALTYERFNFTEADVNNVWKWGLYSAPLMNLKIIMDKAVESNSPHFGGVAKVLMALSIGNMTDVWNDIPYSEAFMGNENLTPKFDNQQTIYATINTLLDGAISDLGSATSDIALDGDIIYGNDVNKWMKAAYVLKARMALHLAKKNGYAPVITALAGAGFTSNSDDLEVPFGAGSPLENNPKFQFDQQRGDIRMGKFLIDEMIAMGDPRLPLYATANAGVYSGSAPGAGDIAASDMGDYYASANSDVNLLSYVEYKFIEAEAKFMTNDLVGAATAHNDAVMASLNKHGVAGDSATFETMYANEDQTTITLDKIIMQKYVALFMSVETWSDWRRTGIPTLALPANAVFNEIPRRYPYPTSEKIYNTANVPSVILTNHVWWDL